MNTTDPTHRKGLVASTPHPNASNFWLYDSQTGFDLTRPSSTLSSPSTQAPRLTLATTTLPITISPPLTALVIIDMQNFFLSPLLGRPPDSKGLLAQEQLLKHAIPAARRAGIRVVWLNWGLTEEDLRDMPPGVGRAFGFETLAAGEFGEAYARSEDRGGGSGKGGERAAEAAIDSHGVNELAPQISRQQKQQEGHVKVEAGGKNPRIYRGLGSDIGPVTLPSAGETVPGGRLLFRDTWNAALTPELDAEWQKGRSLPESATSKPDVWLHKNRMSGFWGSSTPATEFFEKEGIKTLLFAGVNTDQCVGGSLQDAFSIGYDVVLLRDGCGTTSPGFAREMVEWNCAKTWGFVVECAGLGEGVERMLDGMKGRE